MIGISLYQELLFRPMIHRDDDPTFVRLELYC